MVKALLLTLGLMILPCLVGYYFKTRSDKSGASRPSGTLSYQYYSPPKR